MLYALWHLGNIRVNYWSYITQAVLMYKMTLLDMKAHKLTGVYSIIGYDNMHISSLD